ncbi:MAG: ABC transporter permease [Gemmatimonadales bacterium]
MDKLWQDLRYAVRTLSRTPAVTLIAVVTLALGIGVNTTVFSCVNALFLRPFPYGDPLRLVALRQDNPSRGWTGNEVSHPNFVDWQAQARSFQGIAAHYGSSFNLAGGDRPERIEGEAVSWNLFGLLRIAPMLGRDFTAQDGLPGAPPVALLSAALWQRHFGGDSGIVGRTISLSGQPHTVIGVLPPPHQFPADQQLWVPIREGLSRSRGMHYLEVIGRLRDGVTVDQANAELVTLAGRLETQYPEDNAGWSASVVPLREHEVGEYKLVLQLMMAAVAFVLLIACANVANLLLSRAAARHREIAIRAALGAGRVRIVRQLLTESVLIALAGAALGLVVALWGLDLIVAAVPADKPFWMVFSLDGRVLAFTAAVAIATGVLFGLAPALHAVQTDLHESLKEGSRSAGTAGARQRLRHALVVAEVALSLVLLIGAALMIRSFLLLQRVNPGFDRSNVLSVSVVLAGTKYDSAHTRTAFYTDLLPRLAALPGVLGAAASSAPPLSERSSTSSFTVEGQPTEPGQEPNGSWQAVTAGYLGLLGVPILRGRDVTEQDVRDSSLVAVINRSMARRFWPAEDPLGKRFHFGSADEADAPWITVVGVAGDVRHRRLSEAPANQFYIVFPQAPFRGMVLLVRTAAEPVALARAVRETVRSADDQLPVYSLQSMEQLYRSSMWEQRLYGWMFGAFAGVALLLAVVGLYGVMAYMVTLRTHEIGVRMALGAERANVRRLVVRRGLRLAAIGIGIGLVGAMAVTGTLRGFLFGVTATDPVVFLGIALLLTAVALVASYLPARRAAQVDPVIALRSE